jgi:hypothetical protein
MEVAEVELSGADKAARSTARRSGDFRRLEPHHPLHSTFDYEIYFFEDIQFHVL